MFSILRRFIFTILLAQWIYAEAILLAPASQPVLDTVTQFLRPPTHDKWAAAYRSFQVKHADVIQKMNALAAQKSTTDVSQSVDVLVSANRFDSMR